MKMFNRKGQNIAEYSILIALVIGAAVAMQVYVKRGFQGRVKDAVDHTGAAATVGDTTLTFSGNQYEPGYAESNAQVSSERGLEENVGVSGLTNRTNINEETKRAVGSYEKTTYNGN
jgi:uncharacterized protein (UPF0333 family)